MTLVEHYEEGIIRGDINDDPAQRQVLWSMQRLLEELEQPKPSWFSLRKKAPIKGIYLHGPVGVGKTYLMDMFYQDLQEKHKARFHFHHFMQQIDAQLRKRQGQKDPLRYIAADIAKSIRLLCFDEFLIHDVAYAMILAEFLQALFANGIIIVVTANTKPDDLYLNGVHRERFIPAIELIKTRCEVISLSHPKDYRLGRERILETYLYPLDEKNQVIMAEQFASLTKVVQENGSLNIQNREIPYIKCGEQEVWFDFKVICNLPRSNLDYLEIAERFDTVFLSGIPQLSENDTVYALLLIHFIDVLYDRGIRLIISAAVPLEDLYLKGEVKGEFTRTLSRLQEMQAADYLQRHPWRHEHDLSMLL
ncbi:ATPase N2B (nucleotide (GTP) binding protein) [Legionella nautarum]|uniref:ATPase N2B (Nucleotide (GTP) binding protein) n=1 Tax=Legionella nautarum TaxID=45070 RepID=A0A0W0WLE1_9GAMM|nr:cell division protein ZapE [Legionella nautarum]KTD33134.1 ATPase N2B (nucleotide (GTP) binding protein) [Legionella nautarum]